MSKPTVRRYEIRDVTGRHIATHVRRDIPDGGKAMKWEQPDGTLKLGGIAARDLPLYGIDKLGKAPEVVICAPSPRADGSSHPLDWMTVVTMGDDDGSPRPSPADGGYSSATKVRQRPTAGRGDGGDDVSSLISQVEEEGDWSLGVEEAER